MLFFYLIKLNYFPIINTMNSIDKNDKQKVLVKYAINFLKMFSEEECENIQIKFWVGLEEQIKNIGLDNDIAVKIIFEEILNKKLEILENKNLLFCMTSFLRERSQKVFDSYFLNLVFSILQNYENYENLFSEFVGELIFNFYLFKDDKKFNEEFEGNQEIKEKIKKLFFSFIDFDCELFSIILKNNIEFESDYLFFLINNKEYCDIVLHFLETLNKENQSLTLLFLLEKLDEVFMTKNSELIQKNIQFIYTSLCNLFFNNGVKISNKGESDEMGRQSMILILMKLLKNIKNLLDKNQTKPVDEQFSIILDKFLSLIFEQIITSRKLFFSNVKIFTEFYENKNLSLINFRNLFLMTLYSFFEEVYDKNSLIVFSNLLDRVNNNENLDHSPQQQSVNFILTEIILKLINFNAHGRYLDKTKVCQSSKAEYSFKIMKITESGLSNNFSVNSEKNINLYNSSNFEFLNFFISEIFVIDPSTKIENKIIINFNETKFLQYLKIFNSMKLEAYDTSFHKFILKLVFRILTFFYDGIYLKNPLPDNKNTPNHELFNLIFSNLYKISDKQFLKTEIYPLILNFLQTIIFPNYTYFSGNLKTLDLFFDFLFEFKTCESILNITCKLLVSLFNLKLEINPNEIEKSNKYYAINIYADLVEKINSAKIFTQFFNFCTETLKKEEQTQSQVQTLTSSFLPSQVSIIIYSGILKYARIYEGALQHPLLDFVFTKFEKNFDTLPESNNFETLFSLSAVYNFLVKDQPERIVNKIYENFFNKKILRICDKFFKDLSQKEEKLIKMIFENDQDLDLKYEHIHSNLEKLSLLNLITKNKLEENHISLSILLTLTKIFGLFISNIITNNKDRFDVKTLSDQNNQTITSLLQTFDYITNGILFKEGANSNQKNISQLIFLNEFFSHFENLNFFYNTHSYYMTINHIEKNNLDLSQLKEINTIINRDKNKEFINFMKLYPTAIYLMKNLINNIFYYEASIIYLHDTKKYAMMNNSNKIFVVESLYDKNSTYNIINAKNEFFAQLKEKKSLNATFIKEFLDIIYSTDSEEKNYLKLNENVYLFMLHHNLFIKYFKNISDLLNFDLILINIYSVVKKNKNLHILVSFINFILIFAKMNKNVMLFSLRLILNKNIFSNIFFHEDTIINDSFNLLSHLLNQIIFYSSYKNESFGYIQSILENIENSIYHKKNENQVRESPLLINLNNLTFYGKLVTEIFNLLKIHTDETSHRQIEINKKFNQIQEIVRKFI
jgi:hypothetical protein